MPEIRILERKAKRLHTRMLALSPLPPTSLLPKLGPDE